MTNKISVLLTCTYIPKGANTLEEAVGQFYENPEKYTPAPPTKADPPPTKAPMNLPRDTKAQDLPPQYTPPTRTARRTNVRPHTNPVIEAGHIRARDEVKITFTLTSRLTNIFRTL
jgi:hypothetical protein